MIRAERPELLDLFNTYQNEAIAGRRYLQSSLSAIDANANILEVGGGILALAVQLSSEDYREGFNGIDFIMRLYLELADSEDLAIHILQDQIEDCKFKGKFHYIFSINVMEHLKDPYSTMAQLVSYLEEGGVYRFLCPNYDFPYEPHFSKILVRRKNGAFYLGRSALKWNKVATLDSEGLYFSLNFITTRKVKKVARLEGFTLELNQNIYHELVLRAFQDPILARRHPTLFRLVQIIKQLGLISFLKFWPTNYQPITDIQMTKSQ